MCWLCWLCWLSRGSGGGVCNAVVCWLRIQAMRAVGNHRNVVTLLGVCRVRGHDTPRGFMGVDAISDASHGGVAFVCRLAPRRYLASSLTSCH